MIIWAESIQEDKTLEGGDSSRKWDGDRRGGKDGERGKLIRSCHGKMPGIKCIQVYENWERTKELTHCAEIRFRRLKSEFEYSAAQKLQDEQNEVCELTRYILG